MLPRKLHIEQINRFHDEFTGLDEKINKEENTDTKIDLLFKYRKMVKLWDEIDNFIEFKLKHELDILTR